MDSLTDAIVSGAGSPPALVALFLLVVLDGFFPPVPSETAVVAMATVAIATGATSPWAVLLVAAAGSVVGDNIAFLVGRRLPLGTSRWARRPRIGRVLDRGRSMLAERPASVILTARFIPVGRVAVNVVAGSTGFPHRRFLPLTAVSGLAWAGFSVLIGILAGAWMHDRPLLGAAIGMVTAVGLGLLLDAATRGLSRRRARMAGARLSSRRSSWSTATAPTARA